MYELLQTEEPKTWHFVPITSIESLLGPITEIAIDLSLANINATFYNVEFQPFRLTRLQC